MVKEFEKDGYWAVVLGGSSGLGLASAKKLAAHGMNICIVHRNSRADLTAIADEFDEIKSNGVKVISFNADAVNDEKRAELIQLIKNEIGVNRVRCLVHSIAKGNLKPMLSNENTLEKSDFLLTIDAMAISLYDWTRSLFEAGIFASDARVISFTSEGNTKAWRNYAAVSAAKAALEAISRNIALEFAPFGLRSNCIQAGITDTQSLRKIPGSEQMLAGSEKRNPLGRITTPEDIANVVYLLCRDEASWINGSVIKADGGESLQ